MSTSVEITRTTALYPDAVFVQWDIVSDESGSITVTVERAGAPDGDWETVASGLTNAYNYLDNDFNSPAVTDLASVKEGTNLFALSRQVYYRVTAILPSSAVVVSPARAIEPGLDMRTRLLKRKMLRDLGTGLKVLNGIELVVLKKMRWGTRCPVCWDPTTKDGTLEHCESCFGTTFVGGFWPPISIRGREEPAPVQTQVTGHGESDMKVTAFTVMDYPHLEYGDVLVDLRQNERWFVKTVSSTTLKSVMVHQKLACSLITRSAAEYGILVDPNTTPSLY